MVPDGSGSSGGPSSASSGGPDSSAGSSSGPYPSDTGGITEAKSLLPRNASPVVSGPDQLSVENGNAAFAFDMYARLPHQSSNLFYAPYAMSSTLAMAYAGALGVTASEMAKALHFALPPDRLHPAFDWLDLQITSRASADTPSHGQSFALHVANSLWTDKGETIDAHFLDTLAVDYGAGLHLVDFAAHPEPARLAINAWISHGTNGKILDLIPPRSIDRTTRLVIADAIYFKANWASEFAENATMLLPFTRFDGSTVQVMTMAQTAKLAYADGSGWQAVELPYDGAGVAMDIVLPAAGADAAFDASLDARKFASIVGALRPTSVRLALPKFRVAGGTIRVGAELRALGMQQAFARGADFSAMSPEPVHLSDVLQQTYVDVDEHGTEAAAATGAVFTETLARDVPAPTPMLVDRPFVVAIRDTPTNTILFLGKIVDPTE